MTDTFERLYGENLKLKEEAKANEELLKTLTAEQTKWQDGIKELARIKDTLQAALAVYKSEADYGRYDVIEEFAAKVEALCT